MERGPKVPEMSESLEWRRTRKDVQSVGNHVAEVGLEYFCPDYVSKNGVSVTERNRIPDTPIMVETDASDYTLVAVLSIRTPDSDYHLVAFHSQMFKYNIHDKELMAIYDAFKWW